jgi:hypothetical protein
MQPGKCLLLCAAVIVIAALLAANTARAQLQPVSLQRTCTAKDGNKATATIVAGQNGNANAEFPRLVSCPGECSGAVAIGTGTRLSGLFYAWDYRWTQIGHSAPSQFGLQVASDVQIDGASPKVSSVSAPGQEDSSLDLGEGDWDSRWLRFSNVSSSSSFDATIFTKSSLQPRPEGAAAISGHDTGTCMLAGPGTAVTEKNQPTTNEVVSQAGQCTVSRIVDARGRTVDIQLLPGSPSTCQLTTVTVTANFPGGQSPGSASFVDPRSQVTFGSNSTYCWPSVNASIWTCVSF